MNFNDFILLTEKKIFEFKADTYIIVDPKLVMNNRDFVKLSAELDNTSGNSLEYTYNNNVIAAFKLNNLMGDYPSNFNNKEVEVTSGKIVVIPRSMVSDKKFNSEKIDMKAIVTSCKDDFTCSMQKNTLTVGNLKIDISEEHSIINNSDPNQV